jgi:acetolactate synthase I/II/III large subunit
VLTGRGEMVDDSRHRAGASPMTTAAAELVTVLNDEGISHVFINPGTPTAPFRDALAEAKASSIPHPQPVICIHEQVALSAAHGHHLVSGRPQVVITSLESWDPNLRNAIDRAQCDRVPVAIFSNSAPGRTPPSAGKWAADPRRIKSLGTTARRALQIARAEPTGAAHVPLPAGALRQSAGTPSRRLPPPRPPVPEPAALEEMAELLAAAESPVIIAGRVGRHVGSVHHLASLAESLAAPVLDLRNHVNLPPRHPLNAATESRDVLAGADAVLLLDVQRPCLPGLASTPLPAQAWLLQIDTDCLKMDLPSWAYPVEIAITADTERALPVLQRLVADRLSGRSRQVHDRRARIDAQLQAMQEMWRARAASAEAADLPDAVLAELDRALPEDTLIVEEAAASGGAALRQIERPPGHFFHGAWSDPGWSVGAALGVRLARPAQPVVAITDEAAFASGLPTAALWAAQGAVAPFLTVVLDRGGRQSRRPLKAPPAEATEGGGLTPEVVAAAAASGAEAKVITHPSEVAAAVEQLLATTRDGVCAVLDIRLPRA